MNAETFNILFPADSLRRSIVIVSTKAVIGTVTPIIAMPRTFDDFYHALQAFLVVCVSAATFISICLDIARKRREAIDTANRRDREQVFRIRRENKSKHKRRNPPHETTA
jgi:xanthine/uracil permease